MRGKLPRKSFFAFDTRNIPAYAGKTHLVESVHESEIGTSPRMRGKPLENLSLSILFRNIPAYAGKTIELLAREVGE